MANVPGRFPAKFVTLNQMRKTALTILSLIFICSSTELHQFIRLPFLVQHFRQHQKEDPGMGLFAFLKDHYQGEQDNEKDSDEDTQLPLRSTDPILHLGQFEHHASQIDLVKPEYQLPAYASLPDPALAIGLQVSIFQPPRIA
jgi:hypothetical protein